MKFIKAMLDTNVYGNTFEGDNKSEDSIRVIDYAKKHKKQFYGTYVTIYELYNAGEDSEELLNLFFLSISTILEIDFSDKSKDRYRLAWKYIQKLKLSKDQLDDCRILAIATIAGIDMIITWNRRGLFSKSNLRKIKRINRELGYKTPRILTPQEFLSQISF